MENAGVYDALKRGIAILRRRSVIVEIPDWVTMLNFVHATAYADPWEAGAIIASLRASEKQLRTRSMLRAPAQARWPTEDPEQDVGALPPWAADAESAQIAMVIALTRMALGAAVEAAFAEEALDCNMPGSRTGCDTTDAARHYNDAFLAAVWTSAHACYVSAIQSGVEEPPLPELSSVPNAAAEFDFSDLYSRRTCARLCPKSSMPLLSVFMRSTYMPNRLEPSSYSTSYLCVPRFAGILVLVGGTRYSTARLKNPSPLDSPSQTRWSSHSLECILTSTPP